MEEFGFAFISNPLSNETDGSDFLDLLQRLGTVYYFIKSVPAAQTNKERRARKRKISIVVPDIRKLLKATVGW